MQHFRFVRASSVAEACGILTELGTGAIPLAGGTDLLVKTKRGVINPKTMVDLSGLDELKYVQQDGSMIRIGALTPLANVATDPLVKREAFFLAQAAGWVGSRQIRNIATIGGNLCNAAPSADTAAPLLALDAQVTINGPSGIRQLPLVDFLIGPGRTVLATGEIMTEIYFRQLGPEAKTVYLKHTRRRAMDVATVGVAAVYMFGDAHTKMVRIALSAVAPTPIRVPKAEELLLSNRGSNMGQDKIFREAADLARSTARPIDDVRASAGYRKHIVGVLTVQALETVFSASQQSKEG